MKTIVYKNGIKQIISNKIAKIVAKHIANLEGQFLIINNEDNSVNCIIKIIDILYIE